MKIIKNITCAYSTRNKDNKLVGGRKSCIIVRGKGDISFSIEDIREQLLIPEKVLREALKKNISIETEGVYLWWLGNQIMQQKCVVHINLVDSAVNLYAVDIDNSIGLKRDTLKMLLDIK